MLRFFNPAIISPGKQRRQFASFRRTLTPLESDAGTTGVVSQSSLTAHALSQLKILTRVMQKFSLGLAVVTDDRAETAALQELYPMFQNFLRAVSAGAGGCC